MYGIACVVRVFHRYDIVYTRLYYINTNSLTHCIHLFPGAIVQHAAIYPIYILTMKYLNKLNCRRRRRFNIEMVQ